MTEEREPYDAQVLLKSDIIHVTLEPQQDCQERADWAQMERMLIPLLNHVRKVQGKKPIIVPRG